MRYLQKENYFNRWLQVDFHRNVLIIGDRCKLWLHVEVSFKMFTHIELVSYPGNRITRQKENIRITVGIIGVPCRFVFSSFILISIVCVIVYLMNFIRFTRITVDGEGIAHPRPITARRVLTTLVFSNDIFLALPTVQ